MRCMEFIPTEVQYVINYSVSGNVRTSYAREGKTSNRRNEE